MPKIKEIHTLNRQFIHAPNPPETEGWVLQLQTDKGLFVKNNKFKITLDIHL